MYEVESKDDWTIHFVHPNRVKDLQLLVPNYGVICPNCKLEEDLLFDPEDLINTEAAGTVCTTIPRLKQREDWNERFKVNVKYDKDWYKKI